MEEKETGSLLIWNIWNEGAFTPVWSGRNFFKDDNKENEPKIILLSSGFKTQSFSFKYEDKMMAQQHQKPPTVPRKRVLNMNPNLNTDISATYEASSWSWTLEDPGNDDESHFIILENAIKMKTKEIVEERVLDFEDFWQIISLFLWQM